MERFEDFDVRKTRKGRENKQREEEETNLELDGKRDKKKKEGRNEWMTDRKEGWNNEKILL